MSPEAGTMVFGRMAAPSMEAAEPKTLTLEELNYARAALHVLRTMTAEEAIRIFTDGLKPVLGSSSTSATTDSSSSDDDVDLDSSEDYSTQRGGRHGRRRPVKRDIATAPF
ncbi:uncharacterized protein [Lolium perenne]|uniref:uncharacterized protein isoform X2 n=1 Tax=Lolium perenne TaxID=4522 RepID=UPI0021F5CA47|nr:uncharacterized protein LOC127312644 isoform X2 [Lolium perenne]